MADPLRGIVYNTPNGQIAHLPLEEVRINAFIVDVSARVTLRQAFTNPSTAPTSRAKYVFPVPARAAVCAFEMHFPDRRVISGVVKERAAAAEEHERALNAGQATGLVEWVTDDVFTISVGSIPAKQTVTVKIVFVMDLMDDTLKDEVRFQLPMSVGARYGTLPSTLTNAGTPDSRTRLRITVEVQTHGPIHRIASPSHPSLTLVPYTTSAGRPSHRRQTARLKSREFLGREFVLSVHAAGLDAPRCFAERGKTREGHETVALQLTLVPKLTLPPVPAQEYIFLVDRSGSMSGGRIAIAKRTLGMLLRMLPSSNTMFNIWSFGTNYASLWTASQGYNAATMANATSHVQGMDANFGGTEIKAALQATLDSRSKTVPTVVFVLTDGEAYDIDETCAVVRDAVALAAPATPLRVFTLGIGDTVSSAMVEGIARAGNGECLFATSSESIAGKCAKLFRAGRSSYAEDISIDWGVPGIAPQTPPTHTPPAVNFVLPAAPDVPVLQQSPAKIAKIYSGMRFVVFAIIALGTVPKQVVLRGRLNGGDGPPFELVVPVSTVRPFDKFAPASPFVHTLAARHLITDIVEGTSVLPRAPSGAVADVQKAAVVRLGEEYQLASRYTSFVAVDRGQTAPNNRARRAQDPPPADASSSSPGIFGSLISYGSSLLARGFSKLFGPLPAQDSSQRGRPPLEKLPGAFPSSSSSSASQSPPPRTRRQRPPPESDNESYDSFSTMSSLIDSDSYSDSSSSHSTDVLPIPSAVMQRMRSPSPALHIAPPQRRHRRSINTPTSSGPTSPAAPPLPEQILDLVQLQSFDGSFSLDPSLGQIVGVHALEKPQDVLAGDSEWATALAAAFLQKRLLHVDQADLLDGLLDKIREFVETSGMAPGEWERLVERAKVIAA
ncbi:hypothetical protein PLICRDRAFT_113205 [Plicaturopsis crispa FD-325 SS-3]|nr:hypothetical protein PLICRDRAFT_113205 [Plicaturopsis crispa FD-325 SS-3]